MTVDQEMKTFLEGVVGVVEANSYERHCLWVENRRREFPHSWEENLSGFGQVVGHVGDMPVFISLLTAKVAGHKILFVYPTSQVVDHRMIDAWLKENLPKTAFRADGYLNREDAMNFCNVFPRGQN